MRVYYIDVVFKEASFGLYIYDVGCDVLNVKKMGGWVAKEVGQYKTCNSTNQIISDNITTYCYYYGVITSPKANFSTSRWLNL